MERPVRVGVPSTTLPIAGASGKAPTAEYPTFQLGQLRSSATIKTIASFEPDVLIVACFPRLIPRAIREIPALAALNIHPSLLPAHRGPDPLFWIMRAGGAGCGVTIHELDVGLDTGAILAQRAILYPDGAGEPELEMRLASVGAELAANVVEELASGECTKRPQDARTASYESWPSVDDYAIDTNRPARHAWNFTRGAAGRRVPVRVDTDSGPIHVSDALAFGERDERPVEPEPGQVIIDFKDGWLLGRLSHDGGS
ncbi:MAG: formyltransferase family protein [Thermomicrobiales bacterium]